MKAATLGRSLVGTGFRRWRALRLRTRAALMVAALALLAGAWLTFGRADPWPPRATLKTPRDTWPLGFAPDGRKFFTSGEAGVTSWDARTGRQGETWAIKTGWNAIQGAFSPDGRVYALALFAHPRPNQIVLIDTATGRAGATLETEHPATYHFGFDPDGRTLRAAVGDSNFLKEVITWDVATGRRTATRAITAPTSGCDRTVSPDGRTLAYIPFNSSAAQLWDLETDRSLGGLLNPTWIGVVGRGAGFSQDGRTLAVGRRDGAIDLWDVPGRRLLRTLPAHSSGYASTHVQFSTDGRSLASSGWYNGPSSPIGQLRDGLMSTLGGSRQGEDRGTEMVVIDLATARRTPRLATAIYPVFSPDGRTVATRERDFSVKLRDLPGP